MSEHQRLVSLYGGRRQFIHPAAASARDESGIVEAAGVRGGFAQWHLAVASARA